MGAEITPAKLRHRACDECRQRKVSCSKEPDGCTRCKRENIRCNYSEQKTMGRPRKRQFIEASQDSAGESVSTNEFLDLAQPYFIDDMNIFDSLDAFEASNYTAPCASATKDGCVVPRFGEPGLYGAEINFENLDTDSAVPALYPTPDLVEASNPSSTNSEPLPAQEQVPCGCLSALYLSLAALQQFPLDIAAALKTVRNGAATAANVIWCPACGSIVLDNPIPPIEGFQNTMLLGTIIPIVANGYGRLLKMIDAETEEAIAKGQTKMFRLRDYGGFRHGPDLRPVDIACTELESVEMPAQQWRSTVRALLRIDIYGYQEDGFRQRGLKDLISDLELRQMTRHDMLDKQIADGTLDESKVGHGFFNGGNTGTGHCGGDQTRNCMQMLRVAKVAIDNLIIP